MMIVREHGTEDKPVIWIAEPDKADQFVIVIIGGGPTDQAFDAGYGHLGFSLESKEAVDAIADKARHADCLLWEPRQDPWPANYYCGVLDPAGNQVEFSFGQPLG